VCNPGSRAHQRISFDTQNLPRFGEILQTEDSATSVVLLLNVTAVARTNGPLQTAPERCPRSRFGVAPRSNRKTKAVAFINPRNNQAREPVLGIWLDRLFQTGNNPDTGRDNLLKSGHNGIDLPKPWQATFPAPGYSGLDTTKHKAGALCHLSPSGEDGRRTSTSDLAAHPAHGSRLFS
jgi:hypothetical protein